MFTMLKMFDKNKHRLTEQQYKAIKGQYLAGDTEGALKGFYRIIRKNQR